RRPAGPRRRPAGHHQPAPPRAGRRHGAVRGRRGARGHHEGGRLHRPGRAPRRPRAGAARRAVPRHADPRPGPVRPRPRRSRQRARRPRRVGPRRGPAHRARPGRPHHRALTGCGSLRAPGRTVRSRRSGHLVLAWLAGGVRWGTTEERTQMRTTRAWALLAGALALTVVGLAPGASADPVEGGSASAFVLEAGLAGTPIVEPTPSVAVSAPPFGDADQTLVPLDAGPLAINGTGSVWASVHEASDLDSEINDPAAQHDVAGPYNARAVSLVEGLEVLDALD